MSEMRSYSTEQTINPTVSTQGFEDGETLNVRVRLLNSDEQELGKRETNTNVQNHQASYSFRVKELAQELHIDLNKVAFVKCWIDADGDGIVDYNEEITARISGCYCNRDFTVDEVKNIVKKLRQAENLTFTALWNYTNCPLPQNQETYELLTIELNNMMKKYEINTCIRKIHFLAQVYHETQRFTTTLEIASGNQYNPGVHPDAIANGNTQIGDGPKYRGRGFMQLTWKKNYKTYQQYSGTECIQNYSTISNNLHNAVDSAGWFWSIYRKANFSSPINQEKYQEILNKSLNLIADYDDKYLTLISKLVNGGSNGMAERELYFKSLKTIFDDKKCVNNG